MLSASSRHQTACSMNPCCEGVGWSSSDPTTDQLYLSSMTACPRHLFPQLKSFNVYTFNVWRIEKRIPPKNEPSLMRKIKDVLHAEDVSLLKCLGCRHFVFVLQVETDGATVTIFIIFFKLSCHLSLHVWNLFLGFSIWQFAFQYTSTGWSMKHQHERQTEH